MSDIILTDEYLEGISHGLKHDVGFQWLASKSQLLSVIDELLSLRQQLQQKDAHIKALMKAAEKLIYCTDNTSWVTDEAEWCKVKAEATK